jgi:hypothetical protein
VVGFGIVRYELGRLGGLGEAGGGDGSDFFARLANGRGEGETEEQAKDAGGGGEEDSGGFHGVDADGLWGNNVLFLERSQAEWRSSRSVGVSPILFAR